MKFADGHLSFAPTDLANFLACRRKTALDLSVAKGQLERPAWIDPLADVLRRRGDEHEHRYVEELRAAGLTVIDLGSAPFEERHSRTLDAMRAGADVIVQAALTNERWLGYADVLRRVAVPCPTLGAWSYEAHDTKLSRETRGGTILQLCVYTDLLGELQELTPEFFHVVTPVGSEKFRFNDFGALYRQVKARFVDGLLGGPSDPVPDPVDHCSVCRWWSRCNSERRAVDHLSFVAGMGRYHQIELVGQGISTLAKFAETPIPLPFKLSRGAKETYERLREQARLQLEQRESGRPTYELLPIDPEFGLTQLPEPRPGDLFLDLEGDPFARPIVGAQPGEGSREYLFGLGRLDAGGVWTYTPRWGFTDADERKAFEAVMTEIMAALEADPSIHVYHYAPYEPSAFKRLMGRYARREADVDRLLRGRRFVDLYSIVRHTLRAGVEKYSIKDLEPFYGFTREVKLDDASDQRRIVEIALETGEMATLTAAVRAAVEGYNKDDCRSALELRQWLELIRAAEVAKGVAIVRPPLEPAEPSESVSKRQARINALRAQLLDGLSEANDRTPEEQARYLLAYLLDWHYREDKVVWWEYFRLLGLSDEELLDEPSAVAGLEFVERVDVVRYKSGKPTGSVVDRYRYPPQECEIRPGSKLTLRDKTSAGEVVAVDRSSRTLDIWKGPSIAERHPISAFAHERYGPEQMAESLFRLGEHVAAGGFDSAPRAAVDLLLRRTPRLGRSWFSPPSDSTTDYAVSIVGDLDVTTLPIQGPPGSGKTFTGARMICELVRQGKRVGVTATSHKVIRNLLRAVNDLSSSERVPSATVKIGHRKDDAEDDGTGIAVLPDNASTLVALHSHAVNVVGGTAWLWSRAEFANSVDVLFFDEAGQMSLANALAVSQAAPNLVLLGDPQQLEQPQKGSHPDGTEVSVLDHVLGEHQTMPEDRGIFLPTTWRLAPSICNFTSELFYEGRLRSKPGLERQRLVGTGRFEGAGLFVVDVQHEGCRTASDSEADEVFAIISELIRPGARWIDERGCEQPMTAADILVVAPYNAHVARLRERLAGHAAGDRVGTVDKFQGQEAPVVIYSMATSRAEDAPRGMEFLYSRNRLNVATSRAKCVCILVSSPRLFEPECKTPRQMRLVNALARYTELAAHVAW